MVSALGKRMAAHLVKRHEWYWAPLAYCAIIAFIYRDVFFPGSGGQRGLGWDTIEAYWADLAYLKAHFMTAELPLWNPYERAGYPYFAVPERGMYYPVNWLLAGWGAAVGETSWWLVQIKGFGHHLVAALTMHAYLRTRKLAPVAALAGGTAWLSSAPMLIHKASSVIWPMVWTPLVWITLDRLVARPGWRSACMAAGAVLLAGHAGSAPGFFYVLLMIVPYGAYRMAAALWHARADRRVMGKRAVRLIVFMGMAAVMTVLMMLVVVVPAGQLTAVSQRAERSLAYVLQLPLPAFATITGLWAPSTGAYDAFMGVAVMLLALVALVVRPRADQGAPLFFAALAGLFLVLAFGGQTPLLPWLARHVPGFDLFRVSNRYKLLVAPMLAVLAGHGAAALMGAARAWSRERIRALVALAATLAIVIVLVLAVSPPVPAPWASTWPTLAAALVAAILAGVALALPARGAAVAVLLLAVLIAYQPQSVVHHRGMALEPRMNNLEDARWLAGLADVRAEYRIYDEFVLEQRAGSRLGVREFRGYPARASLEPLRYGRVLDYARHHPEILQAFNIRYVLHGAHHRIGKRANVIARPPDQAAPGHYTRLGTGPCAARPDACPIYEAAHPAPLVAWYGAIDASRHTAGTILDILRRQLASDGVLRVVALDAEAARVVEPGLLERLSQARARPPAPVAGTLVRRSSNQIRVRIDAPSAGIVVVNEAMYPGWQVTVDSAPATPFFANWLVRGVVVPAGEHIITWRFRPPAYEIYRLLFTLGFFAILAALVLPRRPGLRPGRDPL